MGQEIIEAGERLSRILGQVNCNLSIVERQSIARGIQRVFTDESPSQHVMRNLFGEVKEACRDAEHLNRFAQTLFYFRVLAAPRGDHNGLIKTMQTFCPRLEAEDTSRLFEDAVGFRQHVSMMNTDQIVAQVIGTVSLRRQLKLDSDREEMSFPRLY